MRTIYGAISEIEYNATNGQNWRWNGLLHPRDFSIPGSDPCEDPWQGVTCDVNDINVTEIQLNGYNLVGMMPAELGSLSSLQRLHLYSNQLNGTVPAELGSLSSLQRLYLYNNQLNGTVPAELGSLSSLQYLYLYSNQLTGAVPAELGSLSSLQYLYLSSNQFSGRLSRKMSNLTEIKDFVVTNNILRGTLPEGVFDNMEQLENLLLGSNMDSGSTPTVTSAGFKKFDISDNAFVGNLPDEYFSLPTLKLLSASVNCLSPQLPHAVCNSSSSLSPSCT